MDQRDSVALNERDANLTDPHSESEIDAKLQQQLVFKFYISELQKLFTISLFIYKSFRDTKLTKINTKIKHIIIQERCVAF